MSLTAIYISTTSLVVNSSAPSANETLHYSSSAGLYTSSNGTTSAQLGGPTASYANISLSYPPHGTKNASVPAGYMTVSTGQQTVTTAAPWTVPSNGSGFAYASKCTDEWQVYFQSSLDVRSPSSLLYNSTFTVTKYSAPLTTLCSDNTQIAGPLQSTGTTLKALTSVSSFYNATITLPPTPSCTVPRTECSAIGMSGMSYFVPEGCSTSSTCGGQCTISGSDIQVIYFPLPTGINATKNICDSSPTGTYNSCSYGSWVTSTVTSTQTFTGVTTIGSSTELFDFGTSTGTATQDITSPHVYTSTYTETESECVYSKAGLASGYSNGKWHLS